ncbi:GyrI-like domain-containing protein [Brumimicrobium mesophilum]|uniref:GyrI-like domain-containing protein n=1 Tax=Brumimicrobium mesophilum TaxID=392717 RepID=UPI000D13EDDF|nr:effector binding domain-containing protein [Brumimicrobium mesophilum]
MENVKIESFKVIGISIRTTNENNQAAEDIGKLWGEFMSKNILGQIPNKINNEIYSLYTDYENDHTKPYTAILGCKVESLNEIPKGMIGKNISGGTFNKTSAKGDLTKGLIVNHWSKIFGMPLDRTYTTDFEVFGEKAQNPADAEIDFYVAIKK